jgi:CO/xanthine dehydrogenase Mo-binding subunit
MTKYGIGQPVSRFEDPRLLRGRGRYQDDVNLPGQAYAVFVRSPHAHARIAAIDTTAAAAAPRVLAVYTGEDVARDGIGTMKIHGGVAQGLGQALMEEVAYDPGSGQLLTGSLMDYSLPRADSLSQMHVLSHPVPTKLNPLGAKGAGEAGTVGALPAVVNAVLNALAPLGVRDLDMPATSQKVWCAMRDAAAE